VETRKSITKQELTTLNEIKDVSLFQAKNKNVLKLLELFAHEGQWDNLLQLLNHSIKKDDLDRKLIKRLGIILLTAAEHNQPIILEAIFKLIKSLEWWSFYIEDLILTKSWSTSSSYVCKDEEHGYNALHWAVINHNPAMCRLFTFFNDSLDDNRLRYNADSPIFRAKDHNGYTAFELAILLKYFDCANSIAEGMSFNFFINEIHHQAQYEALLHNINFANYNGGQYKSLIADFIDMTKRLTNPELTMKKRFLVHTLTLNDKDKKFALESLLEEGTALNQLFNKDEKSKKLLKIARYILKELNESKSIIDIYIVLPQY